MVPSSLLAKPADVNALWIERSVLARYSVGNTSSSEIWKIQLTSARCKRYAEIAAIAERAVLVIGFKGGFQINANHLSDIRKLFAVPHVPPASRIQHALPRAKIPPYNVAVQRIVKFAAGIILLKNLQAFLTVF